MTHAVRRAFGCLFALLMIATPAFSQHCGSTLSAGHACTLPTFHSMSLYYNLRLTDHPDNKKIFVRYRKATDAPDAWREGYPLWCDSRPNTSPDTSPESLASCRGSVVYLKPGTAYVFQLATGSDHAGANWASAVQTSGTTWSENFPVDGPATIIETQTGNYSIDIGGSAANGYKVYDGQGTAVITGDNTSGTAAIEINASYVILRGVKVNRAYNRGIYIAPDKHHVVIEDCDVSGWDWNPGGTESGWGTYGKDEYGGIHLQRNNHHIVIQRNKIHDPHYGAHPSDFGTPEGPAGIMIRHADKQNVIRYNEIYSTSGDHRWFHDGIESTDNLSREGGPGSDSDIYHNIVRNVMDDGIEAEGGGRNVRIWGNYIDHSAIGIATTVAHFGPIYIFRNVINRLRFYHERIYGNNADPSPDADIHNNNRGKAFKAYGVATDDKDTEDPADDVIWDGGRQYFFNNTLLQQPGWTYSPPQQFNLGAGEGIAGGDSTEPLRETWSRNNILEVWHSDSSSVRAGNGTGNSFNRDLYNAYAPGEGAGFFGTPTYKDDHGWSAFPQLTDHAKDLIDPNYRAGLGVGIGNFQLDTNSLGFNQGQPLANFTRDIDNVAFARKSGVAISGSPDVGAHDSASPQPMQFGLAASPLTVRTTPPSTITVQGQGRFWGTADVTANANAGHTASTYSWVLVSCNSSCTLTNPQSQTATIAVWSWACDRESGVFRVTVTDSLGGSASTDVILVAWSTGATPGTVCD